MLYKAEIWRTINDEKVRDVNGVIWFWVTKKERVREFRQKDIETRKRRRGKRLHKMFSLSAEPRRRNNFVQEPCGTRYEWTFLQGGVGDSDENDDVMGEDGNEQRKTGKMENQEKPHNVIQIRTIT